MDPFISSTQYSAEPADTVVFTCSDSRVRAQTEEFIRSLGIQRADWYSVPGGPLVLARAVNVFEDRSVAIKRLNFLAGEHGTKRIILISHGSESELGRCAMAKELFRGICNAADRLKAQRTALIQAHERAFREVRVPMESYLAVVSGWEVRFERIA